jgi:hypothetical protein
MHYQRLFNKRNGLAPQNRTSGEDSADDPSIEPSLEVTRPEFSGAAA